MLSPPTHAEMPPPSTASPSSDCSSCLLIMVSLAAVAAVFMVVSAILCEQVFHSPQPQQTGPVPTVWRQGGSLWVEPRRGQREPDVLARSSGTVPLWIQRSNDWFLDVLPASLGSSDSTEDLQRETPSLSSTDPLWAYSEPSWGIQPHVTLQDLDGFFSRSTHNTQHFV